MVTPNIIRLLFCFTFILFSFTACTSSYDLVFDKSESTIVIYSRYRVIANNLIAFKRQDMVSKGQASKLAKYYKVFYNSMGIMALIESYRNNLIVKRQYLNRLSLSVRVEYFKTGVMDSYYILVYNKDFLDELDRLRGQRKNVFAMKYLTTRLDRIERYDKYYKLKQVERYSYGILEEIEYYLKSKKHKTEVYINAEVDMVRFFNDKGQVVLEKGTYDNGRYPFSLRYFYKDGVLFKVEDYRKGDLSAIFYYNKDKVNIKEERYKSGKVINTINYNK